VRETIRLSEDEIISACLAYISDNYGYDFDDDKIPDVNLITVIDESDEDGDNEEWELEVVTHEENIDDDENNEDKTDCDGDCDSCELNNNDDDDEISKMTYDELIESVKSETKNLDCDTAKALLRTYLYDLKEFEEQGQE